MQQISLVLALAAGLASGPVPRVAEQRSISTSRQFLVYGSEIQVRGAVCDLAERIKSNLLDLLELRDDWQTPIVVRLDYPQANFPDAPPARLEVSQLGYGLKLQLNLLLTQRTERRTVERALLRAIVVEFIHHDRRNVPAGTPYAAPPDWFLDGVLALNRNEEHEERVRLLQGFVEANKIAPLEDVVREDRARLDPVSRRLYEAYSEALLRLLLDRPDGRQQMVQYLRDLPNAPNDAMAALLVHFPETLGRSPAKWWNLSVAAMAASDRYEVLSAAETGSLLDHLLCLSIPGRDGRTRPYSLSEYAQFVRLPAASAVLGQVGRQLLLLGARAHPLYRPIVRENYELVRLLARGRTRHIPERLARIAADRELVERQAHAIDDYLNWYEATQLKTISGAFAELLNESAGENNGPRRRDPISVYLDSVEMELP